MSCRSRRLDMSGSSSVSRHRSWHGLWMVEASHILEGRERKTKPSSMLAGQSVALQPDPEKRLTG